MNRSLPKIALLSLTLVAIVMESHRLAAADLAGAARVIDGDTLDVAGQRVRLFGIDAPESKQPCRLDGQPWDCGQDAKAALVGMIAGRAVECDSRGDDRYKRAVAVCHAGDVNLNQEMVRQGWALAYRTYSKDFIPAEAEAQRSRSGIWRGSFEKPWDWRRSIRGR